MDTIPLNVFNLEEALYRPEVMKSLALTQAIANRILAKDDILCFLRHALENSLRILPNHANDPWLAEWCVLLADATNPENNPDLTRDKVQHLFDIIMEESEHGIDMRQSIYFGEPVLSYDERMDVLKNVKIEQRKRCNALF